MAQLNRLLTAAAERAMVVRGEPGVGKTALIEKACAVAAAEGWLVVRAIGVAAEEPFELGVLNQVVFGLKEFRTAVDERDRAVLAPVFGGVPDSVVAVLPLVSAMLNLLGAAALAQPVLLVVDDVHWVDGISAQVLGAVGRRLADQRVRILAGQRARSESVFSSEGWTVLPLAPLGADEAEQLLERCGAQLSPPTKAAVLTAAAGNPLALTELPRFADRLELNSGAMPLTERLVTVFGERLEVLDPGVRSELLLAALDGIAATAESTNRARYVMRNVEPAIEAGLLVADPFGKLVFRHPLVPAAVVHQASLAERRDAHRELADLYENVLIRRASHLAAAASGPDQVVADLLGEAARLSLRRGGLPAALKWLRQAAELCTDPHRRTELLSEAVFVAARAGRIDEAKELLDDRQLGAGHWALVVLADAYRAFHADGEVVSTHRRLLDALAGSDELDDKTVNRLANLLLSITNYAGDEQKRTRTNAALAPLEKRIHPAVLLYRTDIDEIAVTARAIRSLVSESVAFLPKLPDRSVMLLSFAAYCIDTMAEFRAPLQQTFDQLSMHGASIDAIESGRIVLLDLIATGHWKQAQQVGAQCLGWAEQDKISELRRHQYLADLGVFAASRGDLETARRYSAEVTAWAKPRGLNMLLRNALRIAVRVALAEADYETAYQSATAISPPGRFPRHNIQVGDDMLDLVEAAVYTGRLAEARAHSAEAGRLNLPEISPRVAALTCAITAMTAPDSEAEDLYRSALTHPGIAGFPFEHARIALAQGIWLRRRRRPAPALAALELAADAFDRLGARPWADRARAESRAAGVPENRCPGRSVPLSGQERRVAELAATGQTTKEIAAQLNLSTRTVDAHLANAFRKLGITRRARLGTALVEHDAGRVQPGRNPVPLR